MVPSATSPSRNCWRLNLAHNTEPVAMPMEKSASIRLNTLSLPPK